MLRLRRTTERQNAAAAAASEARGREPEEAGPLLVTRGVERSFDVGGQKLHVLKGIDMELYPRQLVMLRGRSGSGKTTLLNLIGGLDTPTQGEIHSGRTIPPDERRRADEGAGGKEIGFIFQAYALLPLLSAYENVELSLRMAGVPKAEWKDRVTDCLELVGLGKRMHHRPFELSGGEQQRVAIAKAIAHRPRLLLADEPTAELDSQMAAQIMEVFRAIIEAENVTICMTTHDPTILEVADHVYEMVDGKFIARGQDVGASCSSGAGCRRLRVLLAVSLAAGGCALLPDEGEEEHLPDITPPQISKKPEYEVTTADAGNEGAGARQTCIERAGRDAVLRRWTANGSGPEREAGRPRGSRASHRRAGCRRHGERAAPEEAAVPERGDCR